MNQNHNSLVSTLWANPAPGTRRQATLDNRLRLMYLSGILAKLQVALDNRSRATDDGDFAADMEDIAEDARDALEEYVIDFSEDDTDEDNEFDADDLPELQTAVRAFDSAVERWEEIVEEVDDDDRISDEQKLPEAYRRAAPVFAAAANAVMQAGDAFCATHDGSALAVVDGDLPVISDDEDDESHYSDAWKSRHGIE